MLFVLIQNLHYCWRHVQVFVQQTVNNISQCMWSFLLTYPMHHLFFVVQESARLICQKNLHLLETFVRERLPKGYHLFPEGQITNRTERFLAAELIREKIIRQLGDELPHTTATEIEAFHTDDRRVLHINAIIFVERDGQKRIVIGSGGSRLRSIGTEARRDMEKAFDCKVMLKLWVKVKSGWSDDIRALRSLGLEGES